MRIAIAQINTRVGDFEQIISRVCEFVGQAREQQADLIVFPELTTCGYPPLDLVYKDVFMDMEWDTLRVEEH